MVFSNKQKGHKIKLDEPHPDNILKPSTRRLKKTTEKSIKRPDSAPISCV
jgi:hypothetical protein